MIRAKRKPRSFLTGEDVGHLAMLACRAVRQKRGWALPRGIEVTIYRAGRDEQSPADGLPMGCRGAT